MEEIKAGYKPGFIANSDLYMESWIEYVDEIPGRLKIWIDKIGDVDEHVVYALGHFGEVVNSMLTGYHNSVNEEHEKMPDIIRAISK